MAFMDVDAMIDELSAQGPALVAAAQQAGTAASVPSCPAWTVADLLRHMGEVHRWAAHVVATAAGGELDSSATVGVVPADDQLFEWVLAGHALLTQALLAAPDDLDCWFFLPAPSPLAFWARRQLHETSVHRMDAQLAAGQQLSPVGRTVAADGVDELLTGLLPRRSSRLRSPEPRSLLLAPEDSPARWWVQITEDVPRVVREEHPADAVLRVPVEEMYAALWNRAELVLDDDTGLALAWRDKVQVSWR